jgi:hypothetical protein
MAVREDSSAFDWQRSAFVENGAKAQEHRGRRGQTGSSSMLLRLSSAQKTRGGGQLPG